MNGIDKSPCENCDSDILNIKPVSNVYEFLQSWKIASQKNNYELYHKLLRSIKPKDLPKGKCYQVGYNHNFLLWLANMFYYSTLTWFML